MYTINIRLLKKQKVFIPKGTPAECYDWSCAFGTLTKAVNVYRLIQNAISLMISFGIL